MKRNWRKQLSFAALFAVAASATAGCGSEGGELADRAAGADAASVRLVTAEFEVEGMTCGGCALATEVALRKLDGVIAADAFYDDETGEGRCTVEYDPARIDPERMMVAIRELGYEPALLAERGGG